MAAMRLRDRCRSERGSQLIEFMLVFPLLLLVIAGIFDFGMLLRHYEVVTNAAREGARVAVLDGYDATDIESRVTQYIDAAGLDGAYTVAVQDVPITTGAGTFTARAVTLDYTYNFAVLGGVASYFGGSYATLPLQAVSVMRAETQAAPAP